MANLMRRMFTSEQIKKIAEKTGTKLYKHSINATEDNELEDSVDVIIINNSKTPITTATFETTVSNSLKVYFQEYGGGSNCGILFTAQIGVFFLIADGTIESYDDLSFTVNSDTVTEL